MTAFKQVSTEVSRSYPAGYGFLAYMSTALHFKLAVGNNSDSKKTSYEQTEFHYVPLLDENRDRDLMDLLPDYLTEDITFSRQQASKFYNRVVDTITKRRADPGN